MMKKTKKLISILTALAISVCLSCSLVSAEEVTSRTSNTQNQINGMSDDVIHIDFNPNTRVDTSGNFTFEFADQVPSDYFLVDSTSIRIYFTASSTVAGDDFEIILKECVNTEDDMADPYFIEKKTYDIYANGVRQSRQFTGLSTNRYYYFVLKQKGWPWNNGTISGSGNVTHVRGVHDYYVGF